MSLVDFLAAEHRRCDENLPTMNTAGLSLEQAPPFSVPLRFFLTAPWFRPRLTAALIRLPLRLSG